MEGFLKTQIVFPQTVFEGLKAHLLKDENEQFAIALCGISKTNNQLRFLCREILKAGSEDLDKSSRTYVKITDDFWRSALYKSRAENHSILICHSHPFSHDTVGFSSLDHDNAKINYAYVHKKIPNVFIGSLVFGQSDVKGMFWDKQRKQIRDIDEVRIIGSTIKKISNTNPSPVRFSKQVFDRQVLLFGEDGQKKFSETSVAVVGCGGLGSITAELLARLGVGDLVLVDDDVLEEPNLNRVMGSKSKLVGKPKVKVLAKHIRTFSDAQIKTYQKSVLDSSVLRRLKDVDVLISGTDTQSSRMALNELSVKYLIPYIDLAFGIFPREDGIEGYGQVRIVLPDGFCLNCVNGINYVQVNKELMSDADKQMWEAAGYIKGVPIKNPSVVSLDCVTASLGVTEFINLVCGIRPVNPFVLYDMMSDNTIVNNVITEKDGDCILCGPSGEQGLGDLSPIPDYLDGSVPDNIPTASSKDKVDQCEKSPLQEENE